MNCHTITIEEYRQLFDNYLEQYLQQNKMVEPLNSAVSHSITGKCKRIRPIFVMLGASILSSNIQDVLPIALAIEMIHNYSLVHDDLPCMDNDDLRHGKPTVHKAFGEGMAVLTGDALLSDAFSVLSSAKITSDRLVKIFGYISKKIGSFGMIAGQCLDLTSETNNYDFDTVVDLYAKKTSFLLEASIVSGALANGADNDTIIALEQYAKNYGIAFQITDDILEIEGNADMVGKSVGSGTEINKNTIVSLVGIEKSKVLASQYVDKCIESIKNIPNSDLLKKMAKAIVNRKY